MPLVASSLLMMHRSQQYVPPRAAWNPAAGRNSPRAGSPAGQNMLPARSGSRGDYYEDTNPRFDTTPPSGPTQVQPPQPAEPLYEEAHATAGRARSPAESDRSNFTSISQRGVNPRWEQPHPPMPNQAPPHRRPVQMKQQRQDVLLNNNPDFQLPGSRGPAPGRGGPGMIPGSAYPSNAI
jgi:hypothetical protein